MGSVRKRVSKVINAITKAVLESLFINSNSITFEFLLHSTFPKRILSNISHFL